MGVCLLRDVILCNVCSRDVMLKKKIDDTLFTLVYRARPSSCSAEATGRGGSSKGHILIKFN